MVVEGGMKIPRLQSSRVNCRQKPQTNDLLSAKRYLLENSSTVVQRFLAGAVKLDPLDTKICFMGSQVAIL